MDTHLLYIVALIGSGTLAFAFFKMKGGFGPFNLRVIGIVLVATFATLLAIGKTDSLNAAMGILGAIAGYLFGHVGANEKGTTSFDIDGETITDSKFAGRDINEMIETMHGNVKEIRDSVVNQITKFTEAIGHAEFSPDWVMEYLFFNAGEIPGEPFNEAAKLARSICKSDWALLSVSPNFLSDNGVMVTFRRTRHPEQNDTYIEGTNLYRPRFYYGREQKELDYE